MTSSRSFLRQPRRQCQGPEPEALNPNTIWEVKSSLPRTGDPDMLGLWIPRDSRSTITPPHSFPQPRGVHVEIHPEQFGRRRRAYGSLS